MDEDWKRYLTMAASGALTGAGMGGLGKILGGSRSLPSIAGAAALGGAAGGTTIPAASYLGESILGAPGPDASQPYTYRAGLGGALAGGALGAVGGGLLGSGISTIAGKAFPGAAKMASSTLPIDNIIVDAIKKKGGTKGALIGSLMGALGLGYMAADEGQQFDTLRNIGSDIQGGSNVPS